MSKPVKQLMINAYRAKFGELSEAAVVSITGIDANDNNALRFSHPKVAF